jgi:hypothetical protein
MVNERIVIDYRAAIKSFDTEFYTIIHSGENLDHTVLDDMEIKCSFVSLE